MKLIIILGSTRNTRFGTKVIPWVEKLAKAEKSFF
jgi:NAD(P)H-dependent FMN reductase